MGWDSNFARLATFTAKGTFRALKGKVAPARYMALLSGAIAVLLEEHPELDATAARTLATKATGVKPAPEFLPADSVDSTDPPHSVRDASGGQRRQHSTAKATGAKSARSKTSPRKTTARKKTTRTARAGTTRRTTATSKTTRRKKAA